MTATIHQIHIENFRSIQRATVAAKELTIFVGKNDSGKSNILRALNLFFNGFTNPERPLNFEQDYNLFVPERAKTAKEIIVRLEFCIPASYQATNGEIIVWEKRWRAAGLHYEEYWGYRRKKNRLGREVQDRISIPDKSNAHALLRQIEFEYVPAIRDARYFDDLRGRIYNIIAEVATKTFRTSSTAFEDSIGEHLFDLTKEIGQTLGFDTRLALPRDLSHIFQRLDFLSGNKEISLDQRGDGIKVRHIPLILKFMAEKKQSLQGRGAAPYSFIWAYEEPENNLEFASAVSLATQLSEFAFGGAAQVLMTTHSPVFYDLGDADEGVSRAHVFRDTEAKGTEVTASASEVDAKMGTMVLLAPRVRTLLKDVREQERALAAAEVLAKQSRPKIFVEGESDKIVLGRCIQLFRSAEANSVDIETKPSGAGHSYVIDMLNGWRSHHKHHPEGPKAVGVVDWDAAHLKKAWNDGAGNVASAKCFCYHKPKHAMVALGAGFRLPVTLEVLYNDEIWAWAENSGMLEDWERSKIYPQELIEKILNGKEKDVKLDSTYKVYVTKRFKGSAKIDAAKYVAKLKDQPLKVMFEGLNPVIQDIFSYLSPN